LVHYEAFDRRAHRCKFCATQINLFGAALTALRQAKGDQAERRLFARLPPKNRPRSAIGVRWVWALR
jgi:hypothetical protein